MRSWVLLVLIFLTGPAEAAKRYTAPSDADTRVGVSVPWLQERSGLDSWSNLTLWDFTDNPAGELLGIVKFRHKSKDQTVLLRSGRRIQLVMHTLEPSFGQTKECGVALTFHPEEAGQYMLTFEYPVQIAQDADGCRSILTDLAATDPSKAVVAQFTTPATTRIYTFRVNFSH